MSTDVFRALVPGSLVLPCEHSDAAITIAIVVEADPVRVVAPGLQQFQAALARGSVDLIKQYCSMWTRFLVRAETQAGDQ